MNNTLVENSVIHINSSNREAFRLLECGSPIELDTITKFSVELLNGVKIDSIEFPECFAISKTDKGVLFVFFGKTDIGLSFGVYNADLFLYDKLNTEGAWFGNLRLFVGKRR